MWSFLWNRWQLSMTKWTLLCHILVTICLEPTAAGGRMEVRLSRFRNSEGDGDNGHCCDGRAFFCFGACDHFFTVCVDSIDGPNNINVCPYGRIVTGHIDDANSIAFGRSIGGTRNPLIYTFGSWPMSVKLKVDVYDHDDNNSHDFVDFMTNIVNMVPAATSALATEQFTKLSRRTVLDVYVKVYCDVNYYSAHCDVYCLPSDDISGHYDCDVTTGAKICHPGWVGTECDTSHDDCVDNLCTNGATCMDIHQGYTCICADGYTGQHCGEDIDECSEQPCMNAGTCTNTVGSYTCNCSLPWTGFHCSERIDFCADNPCNHSTCFSLSTKYQCHCMDGWNGTNCDVNVDECLHEPCQNNGTCLDTHGTYTCFCLAGFTGVNCIENINECANHTCKNNATCVDQVNSYKCRCQPGYTDEFCETDIDECDSNPCHNNATCVHGIDHFQCACVAGTSGVLCEENIDECASGPCSNGGVCVDLINGFRCECIGGFRGFFCEDDFNECDIDGICQNGATCENAYGSYNCSCAPGYIGRDCSIEVNECESNPCLNNGTCMDMIDPYVVTVSGDMDADDKNRVEAVVRQHLVNATPSDAHDMIINVSYETIIKKRGRRKTLINIRVCSDGKATPRDVLSQVMSPYVIAQQISEAIDETRVGQLQRQESKEPVPKVSWLKGHWWVILGIGLVAAIILVTIGIMVRRRQRRCKQREINAATYWADTQNLSTLGFENIVYNVEHQPVYNTIGSRDSDIIPPLDDTVQSS